MSKQKVSSVLFAVTTFAIVGCGAESDFDSADEDPGLFGVDSVTQPLTSPLWVHWRNIADNAGHVVWSDGGLAVCRGRMPDRALHPGKVFAGTCRVAWGGKVYYFANSYAALDDDGVVDEDLKSDYSWRVPTERFGAPESAGDYVFGGHVSPSKSEPMGICEVWNGDGRFHPGKYWRPENFDFYRCEYEYEGRATFNEFNPNNGQIRVLVR